MSSERYQLKKGDHIICLDYSNLLHGTITRIGRFRPCSASKRVALRVTFTIQGVSLGCSFRGEYYQDVDDLTDIYSGMCVYSEELWLKIAEMYHRRLMAPYTTRLKLLNQIAELISEARLKQE